VIAIRLIHRRAPTRASAAIVVVGEDIGVEVASAAANLPAVMELAAVPSAR
jgi:hypothetical protein